MEFPVYYYIFEFLIKLCNHFIKSIRYLTFFGNFDICRMSEKNRYLLNQKSVYTALDYLWTAEQNIIYNFNIFNLDINCVNYRYVVQLQKKKSIKANLILWWIGTFIFILSEIEWDARVYRARCLFLAIRKILDFYSLFSDVFNYSEQMSVNEIKNKKKTSFIKCISSTPFFYWSQ